jgi:leukotriene-A4 hydrolase
MTRNFHPGRILMGLFTVSIIWTSCGDASAPAASTTPHALKINYAMDHHSYSRPQEARVTHLDWDANVDFNTRTISGTATYKVDAAKDAKRIIFDTHELTIASVKVDGVETKFILGAEQGYLGQPLSVEITGSTKEVSITYSCDPGADALLWVEGEGNKQPFLFTQSQAILARTWLPCQDSPGVRFTYNAQVQAPEGLMALMSAENPTEKSTDGKYSFAMKQAIPSYLMALAVGDVEFRAVGKRTGVYAISDLIDAAANEFSEMDALLAAAENLYGPYAWGRYDLLVLPPAFPFGGMENPRLTFVTPTIIAGDRSLVALVAHELAHSWSGNLVTNSTWDDFWLNEGFTVYFEQRIMEAVYGRDVSEMLATLSYQGLVDEVDAIMDVNPDDTHLKLHLQGRNPDDGMTAIAYDKGYFFLRLLEQTVGRPAFDAFLSGYFKAYASSVMDTDGFIAYLNEHLLTSDAMRQHVNLDAWIFGAGLPANCPEVKSRRIQGVDAILIGWTQGLMPTDQLPWESWLYQERYRFLSNLPDDTSADRMAELDAQWSIGTTGNNEVLFAWLEQSIRSNYQPAYPRMRSFLIEVGRRKFLTPLYRAMKETGQIDLARDIYSAARPGYHAVATGTMDELLND